jgi:hypothetical protein
MNTTVGIVLGYLLAQVFLLIAGAYATWLMSKEHKIENYHDLTPKQFFRVPDIKGRVEE